MNDYQMNKFFDIQESFWNREEIRWNQNLANAETFQFRQYCSTKIKEINLRMNLLKRDIMNYHFS